MLYGVYRLGSEAAQRRPEGITRYIPRAGQVRYPLSRLFEVEAETEAEALARGEREWLGAALLRLR